MVTMVMGNNPLSADVLAHMEFNGVIHLCNTESITTPKEVVLSTPLISVAHACSHSLEECNFTE